MGPKNNFPTLSLHGVLGGSAGGVHVHFSVCLIIFRVCYNVVMRIILESLDLWVRGWGSVQLYYPFSLVFFKGLVFHCRSGGSFVPSFGLKETCLVFVYSVLFLETTSLVIILKLMPRKPCFKK